MDRKLVAILAADVVGYSALMERDEEGTFVRLKSHRTELFEPEIKKRHGRVFKLMGDGLLAEFASVVDAVECAVTVQQEMAKRNAGVMQDERIVLRIGVHLGDVIVEGKDRHGDGVNIASRLQSLAEPGGILISGTAYDQVRNKLNTELEFLGEQRVKNIAEPVRVYSVSGTLAVAKAVHISATTKPAIAVLPFANMSGDPDQQYFSDGVTEDIITELSRFRSLLVIARNSSFQYRDQSVDVRRVGRELGVSYVIEGSVRKLGPRLRLTAQLIDACSGNHLWGERYDRNIEELFAVQDEITQTIVATVTARLEDAEIKVASSKRQGNLPAYDCFLRGVQHLRGYEPDDNRRARESFEQAIALDPEYALAHAYLALSLVVENGYSNAPEEIKQAALERALLAVRLDRRESRCHVLLGQIYRFRDEFDLAIASMERGVALNPNDANGIAHLAGIVGVSGRAEEALVLLHQAMRFNPSHPDWYWGIRVYSLYALRRYEECLMASRTYSQRKRPWHLAREAACLAQLGRLVEARAVAAEVLRLKPTFRINTEIPKYKFATDAEHLRDGLRKAGLPE
ncbi:MAG: adenylate/guanylate cyclase domain-containing protein [Mesorhizobium sp.]|nr:MAG: adenylate/guanylate cyclase domain-containing protein [Mesorhizobium sp.]